MPASAFSATDLCPTACSLSLSEGSGVPLLSDLCHHFLTAVALWLAVTWLYILYKESLLG